MPWTLGMGIGIVASRAVERRETFGIDGASSGSREGSAPVRGGVDEGRSPRCAPARRRSPRGRGSMNGAGILGPRGRRARAVTAADRALVVGAGGVEQPDRVVPRLDLVDPEKRSKSAVKASRAADASAPARYSARRARGSTARARSACGRSMATSDVTTMTCSAPAADTSSSSRTIAAGRSQTRCASPRQKPAVSKRTVLLDPHGTQRAGDRRHLPALRRPEHTSARR